MPGAPSIVAANACVIDCDTGSIIYAKNPDTTGNLASVTKLMTCLLACELGTVTDVITVNSSYFTDGGLGSQAGLENGEDLTLGELIAGAIFLSGNDAADIIAEHIGRTVLGGAAGSAAQALFYAEMNDKADTLGMTNSNFLSAHGFYTAGGHVSTPYDICLLSRAAAANADLAAIYAAEYVYVPPVDEEHYWNNRHSGLYGGLVISKTGGIVGYQRALGIVVERGLNRFAGGIITAESSVDSLTMWSENMRRIMDYALKTVGEFAPTSMLLFSQNIGVSVSGAWSTSTYQPTLYRHGFGRFASLNTAALTCVVICSAVEFYAAKSADVGLMEVWVDGVLDDTIDQYAASTTKEVLQWSHDFGEPGEHTIAFIPKADKNPLSSSNAVRFDYLALDDYIPAVQFARPASDVSTTNWTSSTGSGTHASHVDELIPDDADYVYTETNNAVVEFALPSLTDPAGNTGHVVRYRAKGPFTDDVTVSLYQGATLIEQWTQTLTTSYAEYSHTLGSTEADAITDYTALRLRFKGVET